MSRYTITAALPYTNGPVHIGHLAGVYVPADIYARFQRLKGNDVAFICGSDEHGVAISIKAQKEGITPQEIIDKYDKIIRDSFENFGISFDNYSDFDTVWYAIGSSMIENYEPTVQDVIDLKTYVTNRRKELNIG